MNQMISLKFEEIEDRLSTFSFPRIDLVVGIATGGVNPARLISNILDKPLKIIEINFRDQDNRPLFDEPQLIKTDKIPGGISRILLVDDVGVSGKTIEMAKNVLSEYDIISFVLKGKADLVLFPEINTCVSWPWSNASLSL
jgi:hypoxanthine phosphoribosyltransferase